MITYGSWLFFRKERFWYMASAVPLNQRLLSSVMDGVKIVNPPCLRPKSHHLDELRCSVRDLALYCVNTATFCTWELVMDDRAKSMLLKLPAMGRAATARCLVSSLMRLLLPPARIIPMALIFSHLPLSEYCLKAACRRESHRVSALRKAPSSCRHIHSPG